MKSKSILLPLILIIAVFTTGISSANAEIRVANPTAPHTVAVAVDSSLLAVVVAAAVVVVVVAAVVVSETTSTTATTGAVPVLAASGVTRIPPNTRQAYAHSQFD